MSTAPTCQVVERRCGEFLISTDPTLLDLNVIHGFLTNCYWAKGISLELVARSIQHSLCFGIYDESTEKPPRLGARHGAPESRKMPEPVQVGFARVVSDFSTVAYLGDVFVLESHRGRGLSKRLMECIMQHPALQGLRRWILLTRDAHELYSQFGFTPVKSPESYMELHNPGVYSSEAL